MGMCKEFICTIRCLTPELRASLFHFHLPSALTERRLADKATEPEFFSFGGCLRIGRN